MFDAEKLLSKVVSEVAGSGKGKKKGKKKKKGRSGLVDNLTTGAGLMTIIGLGVGAYEILKSQSAQQTTPPPRPHPGPATPPPPPPTPGATPTGALPAVPGSRQPSPATAGGSSSVAQRGFSNQEMACRMIQVMIAAAHADGTLDAEEEKAVLDRLRDAGLDQEEILFLLDELHKPKSIAELTADIDDPSVAKTMYMLALATIDVDTDAEREWLDQLAGRLGLSTALQRFIEEQ